MLNDFDLWSLILYGVTNISRYRHWNSCHTTLYKQFFYYLRIIYLEIIILGTMTLYKLIIAIIMTITIIVIIIILIIIIIIMISTTMFQNITEKLEKMTYFVFTILGVLLPP